jgi:hypothetical protein
MEFRVILEIDIDAEGLIGTQQTHSIGRRRHVRGLIQAGHQTPPQTRSQVAGTDVRQVNENCVVSNPLTRFRSW